MPISPPDVFAKNYEAETKKFFDAVGDGSKVAGQSAEIWQNFFDKSAKGLSSPLPFISQSSSSPSNFAPVVFPPVGGPPIVAAVLANAYMAWANALTWTPPAPIPPFSAITSVISNPATVAAAGATLLAGLTAEFSIIPPGEAGLPIKNLAIGTLFYTAALATGVMVIGIGLPPALPPLTVPLPTL